MAGISNERALWIARYILPYEAALRAHFSSWRLPQDLDIDDIVQKAYSRFAAMASVDQIHNPRTIGAPGTQNISDKWPNGATKGHHLRPIGRHRPEHDQIVELMEVPISLSAPNARH